MGRSKFSIDDSWIGIIDPRSGSIGDSDLVMVEFETEVDEDANAACLCCTGSFVGLV